MSSSLSVGDGGEALRKQAEHESYGTAFTQPLTPYLVHPERNMSSLAMILVSLCVQITTYGTRLNATSAIMPA